MRHLTENEKKKLIDLIEKGKPLPPVYKGKLFVQEDGTFIQATKEYRLVYEGKARREDIAGDITHSGRPDQFALAEERIREDLMGPLWGDHNVDYMRDRLVLVPGNHDVNLRFSACDSHQFNLTTKMLEPEKIPAIPSETIDYSCHNDYSLEPFRRFAHRLTRDRNWENFRNLSRVDRRFLHCGFRFFVLNSLAELSASNPNRASFSEFALRVINRSLGDDEPEKIFSIAVSHHGIKPEGTLSKEKEVDNWVGAGRSAFSMHRIRLWLFGHYHEFGSNSLNSKPFDEMPLWIVQVPTPRIGYSNRGFCLLELRRQAGIINDAYIHHHVLEDGTAEKKYTRRIFEKG